MFKKLGVKFVWFDYLVRCNKIASHIEIYDAVKGLVIIDNDMWSFYSNCGFGHYASISNETISFQ
ncbi:MAG: hypothetical protein RSE41_03170 [Clostridia bacterium]